VAGLSRRGTDTLRGVDPIVLPGLLGAEVGDATAAEAIESNEMALSINMRDIRLSSTIGRNQALLA
jgi:hypothetical protein